MVARIRLTTTEKSVMLILLLMISKNFYQFYHRSDHIDASKDKVLVDEFIDTPIFEELVLDNNDDEVTQKSSMSNSERKKIFNKSRPSCTSPEKTKWVFESCNGDSDNKLTAYSRASKNTCRLCSHTTDPFLIFLNKLKTKMEQLKKPECERLVMYSVAFGKTYTESFRPIIPKLVEQYHKFHNKCLFTFVLYDSENLKGDKDDIHIVDSKDGLDQRILIPQEVLPYENGRRNTKIFKMVGHLIFPWAQYLIWQDAKFRMTYKYPYYWPVNFFKYISETMNKAKTCAVYLSLPAHESSTGNYHINFRKEAYRNHCNVLTISNREQVSDSQLWIQEQCAYYEKYFNNSNIASSYMVDSALMVRDMRSDKCRTFNADLGCTWLDEIHCFSDRDQISFPYALASMDIVEYDVNLDPERDHRVFVDKKTHSDPMALILKSDCHYYFQATVRKCYPVNRIDYSLPPPSQESKAIPIASVSNKKKEDSKRVAIVVSGLLRRYFFESSLQHLIKPLYDQGHHVDYYLTLGMTDPPPTKGDAEYMNHLEYDPIFGSIDFYLGKAYVDNTLLNHFLRKKMKHVGARLKFVSIKSKFKIDREELILARRNVSKTVLFPNEKDPDIAFPMKDFTSKEIKKRTANANRKLLSRYLGIQELWTYVEKYEEGKEWSYDYVLYLHDDMQWLDDFDLKKLLALGDADIYLLSCDDRKPPLHIDELNDYALVVKRSVAKFFGYYFTNLFKDENLVDNCVSSLKNSTAYKRMFNNTNTTTTTIRGCNSGMLLKFMIDKNNFTVLRVGQSYLPFQRSVHMKMGNNKHNKITCFHEYCQSHQHKLDNKGISRCDLSNLQ